MRHTINRAPLKTKKFKADETEKAQLPMGNEHFEVEVKHGITASGSMSEPSAAANSKFLEVPNSSFSPHKKINGRSKIVLII